MNQIHSQFRLNGISFDKETLNEIGYSWVKEGQEFEVHAGNFLMDWLSSSETVTVKTSGSTGEPKALELSKKHMVNSALATGQFFDLKPNNTALLCLSPEYIAGKMMLVRALVLGLNLDVVVPSSQPLESIKKKYDFAAMVPLQAQNSMNDLQHIKTLIIGGAPISKSLRNQLAVQSSAIFETYGMTETITHIAVKRLSSVRSSAVETFFEVLPNVKIDTDERGCLIIDAPKVSTQKVITNDLVELISSNTFRWLGRYDNVINSGGIKLIPEQVEEKLSAIIKNRFFVAGIPDVKLGEKLVLFVEGKGEDGLEKKISSLKTLDKFECPKQIIYVKNFVETPTGKVKRQRIKFQFLKS